MDFLKDAASKLSAAEQQGNNPGQGQQGSSQGSSGGENFLSGLGDKINSAAGGGRESEKNEGKDKETRRLRRTSSFRNQDPSCRRCDLTSLRSNRQCL
jgi:hypothetical protein